jgi:23S rRNA (adenine2503-C2)-methyltransferase
MSDTTQKKVLTGLLPDEISVLLPPGKERYRGMQIFRWIHEQGVTSFEDMTNLGKDFRREIMDMFTIGAVINESISRSSDNETEKYLWRLADGNVIESVVIRDGERTTACISSQVGCRFACAFCRTGSLGLTRNLTAGEIVDQLISMNRLLASSGAHITNVVFMGMGEPFDNTDEVLKAIQIINMETGLSIGQRKITVSTCGVVPGIRRLAETYSKIGLAISLNAPEDPLRSRLMPVNNAWRLKPLLAAAREFAETTGRRVTFEYILMRGVNDTPTHALELAHIAKSLPSKINLIVFNEHEESPFKRPSDDTVETFQKILLDRNLTAMLRKSKGTDILAACGQLAAKAQEE